MARDWHDLHHRDAFDALSFIQDEIHDDNRHWWRDLGEVLDVLPQEHHEKVIGWFRAAKIALIHSEVSEMLEGVRKGLVDDHLPDRLMEEVEGADVAIRLLDFAGGSAWDLAGAMEEKLEYNQRRVDHKKEARDADGGKKF